MPGGVSEPSKRRTCSQIRAAEGREPRDEAGCDPVLDEQLEREERACDHDDVGPSRLADLAIRDVRSVVRDRVSDLGHARVPDARY